MSKLLNREVKKSKRAKVAPEVKLIKDKECFGCAHLIDCKGKPAHVRYCLHYDERKESK